MYIFDKNISEAQRRTIKAVKSFGDFLTAQDYHVYFDKKDEFFAECWKTAKKKYYKIANENNWF